MSLGVELGLGPGEVLLGGDPAHSSPKGGWSPPNFRPMFILMRIEHTTSHFAVLITEKVL